MSLAFDIQTLLVEQGIDGNFSRGYLADKPDDIIGIQDFVGLPPVYTHDGGDQPERVSPGVQITVRKPRATYDAYSDAETKINQIAGALHVTNRAINGLTYVSITMQNTPFSLEPDASGRTRWVANFIAEREFVHV